MLETQAGELDLRGMEVDIDVVQHPVVQRPMVFELERAQRMGDALQGVADAVGVVVHRIDTPVRARTLMRDVTYPIQHGVAQIDVGAGHVDPGAQNVFAIGELTGPHAREQIEILIDRAIPVGAVRTGLGQGPSRQADLFGGGTVDERLARADQILGEFVEFLEVV